ncbi:hypothetical protein OQA88_7666 [Cercophora sp. LCS_1]
MSKCEKCRKDKKKCEPQPREWPQKCNRCIEGDLECSPNTTSREAKRLRTGESQQPAAGITADNPQRPQLLVSEHSGSGGNITGDEDQALARWSLSDISNMADFLEVLYTAKRRYENLFADIEEIFCWPLTDLIPEFRDVIGLSLSPHKLVLRLLRHTSARLTWATGAEAILLAKIVSNLTSSLLDDSETRGVDAGYLLGSKDYELMTSTVQSMERQGEVGAATATQSRIFTLGVIGGLGTFGGKPFDGVGALARLMELDGLFRRCLEPLMGDIADGALPTRCFLFRSPTTIYQWDRAIDDIWEAQDILGISLIHMMVDQPDRAFGPPSPGDMRRKVRQTDPSRHPLDCLNRTLLHLAAQRDQVGLVEALLEAGVEPSAQTITGSTALHYAASLWHPEVCQTLLSSKTNLGVDIQDCIDRTALHYAAEKGRAGIVKLLLDTGASVHTVDRYRDTPLHLAVKGKQVEIVKLLLSVPGIVESFDAMDGNGDVPLVSALRGENLEIIGAHLKAPGTRIDGKAEFSLAIGELERGVDIIELLLQGPAPILDINAEFYPGGTILHWAAENGHTNIVKILLQMPEIDVNARGRYETWRGNRGITPLMSALYGEEPCYKDFLRHPRTDLSVRNEEQQTMLHAAAQWEGEGASSVLEDLLPLCSRFVNARDRGGKTALHFAAERTPGDDCTRAVRTLLQIKKTKVTCKDKGGCTPLHIAAHNGNTEVCRLLMLWTDTRRVSSFEDKDGDTPSSLAQGHEELHHLLKGFEDSVALLAKGGESSSAEDDDSDDLDSLEEDSDAAA